MKIEIEFFMVWSERSTQTKYRHEMEYLAKAEAERLARENPGTRFYVLRAQGYAEQPVAPSIYRDLDRDIPF